MTRQRPLMIGQAPGPSGWLFDRALGGRCGRRLAALAGVSLDEFLATIDTRNLIERFPGCRVKGDTFPCLEARARAEVIKREEVEREVIVFVGVAVASTFGFDEAPCAWRRIGVPRRRLAMIPHPSGINRWYNDRANVALAGAFLRELIA